MRVSVSVSIYIPLEDINIYIFGLNHFRKMKSNKMERMS